MPNEVRLSANGHALTHDPCDQPKHVAHWVPRYQCVHTTVAHRHIRSWPMTTRNTAIRDRHRRAIAAHQPPCSYEHCLYPGEPIDYQPASHLDPLAFTVDHTIPLSRGGPELDVLENKTAMHRACNRAKSDQVDADYIDPPRTYVTTLTW